MDITAAGMSNYMNTSVDSTVAASVRGTNSGEDAALRKATNDFESLFVKQMLNSMKKTINKSGLLDGGMGQEIFEDMLYDEYAQKITETANLGIADMMYQQLSTQRPVF